MPEEKKGLLDGLLKQLPEFLAPMLKPIVKMVLKQYVFSPIAAKDASVCLLVLNEIYIPVDVIAEPAAQKTATNLDDVSVQAVMEAIEEFAAENSMKLANVDND